MSEKTTATEPGIHVVGVEASSFHRLTFARVKLVPGAGLVRLTGKNGSGKTSLLRAVRAALGGAAEVLPAAINEESEDGTGFVRVELSNGFTVVRSFTAANLKGYLTVVGPDGGKHNQTRLNSWLGVHHDFDVLSFFDLELTRQREIILGLAADPELPGRLDELRTEQKRVHDERTPHISGQRRARGVTKPDGERPTPIDVSGEMKRLAELQATQRDRGDVERRIVSLEESIDKNDDELSDARQDVQRLEEQLERAKRSLVQIADRGGRLVAEKGAAEAELADMPVVVDEIEAVTARISQADEVAAVLRPWMTWDEAQVEFAAATDTVAGLTEQLKALREQERKLLAESGLPVEGLTFDEESGEPLLNGRPLAVASGAERIRMAVAIAIAANPQLRVCLVDEANDLDLEALEALRALAEEHDMQVWACRIGLESRGEIVVADGIAKSVDVPEPVEA